MPQFETILYEVDDRVATITLNRPERLNAFNSQMLRDVMDAIDLVDADDDVRAVIFTGAGRGYCAGADLSGGADTFDFDSQSDERKAERASERGEGGDLAWMRDGGGLLTLRLYECNKPLIAAINGACAGLGFSYAVFCDLRFVDRTAKFVTSFSQRGLIAEHGTSWILPRLIGPANALDLFWTGRRVDGEEAGRLGLANRVCEDGECVADAVGYLRGIAENAAPHSLMMMKRQVYRHLNAELRRAMDESTVWMDDSLTRGDFKEGVDSFVERRPPRFAPLKVE